MVLKKKWYWKSIRRKVSETGLGPADMSVGELQLPPVTPLFTQLVTVVVARGRDDRFSVACGYGESVVDLFTTWTPAVNPEPGFLFPHLQRNLTFLAITLLQRIDTRTVTS